MHANNGESSSSSFNGNVHHNGADLKRTESLGISPELFEKLFLSPQTSVAGDLRSTFGNPTPLGEALEGPLKQLKSFSLPCGANWFFGGLLLVISGLLEFFLGNTFPSVVFMSYGTHSMTFAATFQPFYNAIAAFSTEGTPPPEFAASFAFYALFMGLLSVIFLIFSLRTNVIFVIVFIGASLGFLLAAASFWTTALRMTIGATLLKATGGAFFVAAMMGWYLLVAIMFARLDLPWGLSKIPVGDLSTLIKGASQTQKEA
ncbi:related to Y.lipolytica GPR1 protein and Fun34p [Rhynchosporium secalis]|uniref:Related to Y.lipolytica GPR1 protein and Fun34p n=1 Tax=Rhynchosporium secalis TaxID=38038 RepID=A0A1E1MUB6_RHYSE|nr:related to Y.lipolytica GPR1 protein and Fun34p [Rhynchosporium secalis]